MWSVPQNKKCEEPEADSLESKNLLLSFHYSQKSTQSSLFSHLCFRCLKIIQCTGKKKSSATPGFSCLVLQCRVLPMQEVTELNAALNISTFMSVHSPDMKFTYCHSRYDLIYAAHKCKKLNAFTLFGLSSYLKLFFGSGLWSWQAFVTQSCWANPCTSTIIRLTASKSARHTFTVRGISCHLFSTLYA